ncbi:MAG: sulfite exporter TauE/SafE family protein [Deltaproteobacteria bacterium]|nr:sulfite exporter TauE/SafE family protein [Deltaproteobacteria bacterium]
MRFPVSGVETSPLVPLLAAFGVSTFTSLGGVAGGLILVPFQVSVLGFAGPSVNPTNHLFNVLAIPLGVYRHLREGRMLWPLTATILAGSIPGVILGSLGRIYLMPEATRFKGFVALVLVLLGARMLLRRRRGPGPGAPPPAFGGPVRVVRFTPRVLEYEHANESCRVSVPRLAALTLAVGVLGGAYGLGGGALIAPFLVSVFGLPVHSIAGAALMGTCATSSVAVLFFAASPALLGKAAALPDYPLGALFGLGGMAGIYLGARLQRRVAPRPIEGLLGLVCLALATFYGVELARR